MRKILLLAILVFIISCGGESSSSENWQTGTQGITMQFMPNSPPAQVLSDATFDIVVEYSNVGITTTRPTIYFTSFDTNVISGLSKSGYQGESLEGKNKYNPEGNKAYLERTVSINQGSVANLDSIKQPIGVTACYSYSTIASPQVCIDPNNFAYNSATRCSYAVKDLGSSQGAPIAVTQVKQSASGNKVLFEIHFENKGGGSPYLSGNCLELRYSEIDYIRVQDVKISGRSFLSSCKPSPSNLKLNSGRAYIVCDPNLPADSHYETPLEITLSYNYRYSLPDRQLTIINTNYR